MALIALIVPCLKYDYIYRAASEIKEKQEGALS
jgi:hypothetical protein